MDFPKPDAQRMQLTLYREYRESNLEDVYLIMPIVAQVVRNRNFFKNM
jgi:hypothetical protein